MQIRYSLISSLEFKNSWAGHRAFIVASGPSLKAEDCERLRGEKVIAVNCSVRLLPFAQIVYAADQNWWDAYKQDWAGYAGSKYTVSSTAGRKFDEIERLPTESRVFLSEHGIALVGGSGGHAINLAYLLGADPIYLLGFDCQGKANDNHWHEDHKSGRVMLSNPNRHIYKKWARQLSRMHSELSSKGVSLFNCSRSTALTIPRLTLDEALSD